MKEVLVLIPAYNEEESIGDFLKKLEEAGVVEGKKEQYYTVYSLFLRLESRCNFTSQLTL